MTPEKLLGKKYFSKFYDASFLFRTAFLPLSILTLYLFSLSFVLPDGVNKVFADKFWKLTLPLTLLSGFVSWAIVKSGKKNTSIFKNYSEKLSFYNYIFVLLPLTPIVQYILNNQNILSIWQSISIFGIFMLFSILFIVITPSIFGFVGSARTIMVFGLVLTFVVLNMASLSNYLSWFEVGDFKIQVAIFGGLSLFIWFIYDLNYKKFLYFVVIIYFISTSFSHLINHTNNKTNKEEPITKNSLFTLTSDKKPPSTPNIYLIVYDSYVSSETLLAHGIDNRAQEQYLKKSGFKLYPDTYSIGAASVETMSRLLNASTEYYGRKRRAVSGDGVTQNILKGFGYKTHGIFASDHFFRGTTPTYDFYYPKTTSPTTKLLSTAILMGEFRFDLEFDKLPRKTFLAAKQSIFKDASKNQNFIYSHTYLPGHSQNSGSCLSNEINLFENRLDQANIEMKTDIDTLVKSDPKAIIIVAGDHGPYLTKNCTKSWPKYDSSEITRSDIQDRFGSFLAIRWPTTEFEKYDQITVLQDLFPSIFAYIFKDEKILKAKVEPKTLDHMKITSGVSINNKIIHGGINNGEPLFTSEK